MKISKVQNDVKTLVCEITQLRDTRFTNAPTSKVKLIYGILAIPALVCNTSKSLYIVHKRCNKLIYWAANITYNI